MDAVSEFHRVVDFVHQEAPVGILEHVDRQDAAAYGFCGAPAHLIGPEGIVNTAVPERIFSISCQVFGARSER